MRRVYAVVVPVLIAVAMGMLLWSVSSSPQTGWSARSSAASPTAEPWVETVMATVEVTRLVTRVVPVVLVATATKDPMYATVTAEALTPRVAPTRRPTVTATAKWWDDTEAVR